MTNYINDRGGQLARIGSFGGGPLRQIGALGAIDTSTPFDYRAAAQALATSTLSTVPLTQYVVVALELDGANPLVQPFSDATSAADAFEKIYNFPAKYAFAAQYGPDGVIGEQFFAVTQLFGYKITTEMLKSALPWIALGVVAIGGAIYFTRRPATARARSRQRVRHAIRRARRSR